MVNELKDSDHEIFPLSRKNGLDLLNYKSTLENINKVKPDVIINCATHVGSLHYVTDYAADVFFDNALMIINMYEAIKNSKNKKPLLINPIANCSYPPGTSRLVESDLFNGDVHDSVYGFGHTRRNFVGRATGSARGFACSTQLSHLRCCTPLGAGP